MTPQQEPKTYFRTTNRFCSSRLGGPAPSIPSQTPFLVLRHPETGKPCSLDWSRPGAVPSPNNTARHHARRKPAQRPSDFLFALTGTTLRRRHGTCFKRPGAAPAAPLPLSHHDLLHGQPLVAPWIFDRSASPFSPNTDPPRSECRLFGRSTAEMFLRASGTHRRFLSVTAGHSDRSAEDIRNAVFNGQFTATAGSREPSIQHGYPSHAPETGATTLRPVTARAFEGHGPRQGSA